MTSSSSRRPAAATLSAGGILALALLAPEPGRIPEYVQGDNAQFPRIRYADSRISINDRCPVRLAKLNTKMAPLYVNGEPVGFC